MDFHLVVVRPFGQLVRGDVVNEATRIAEVLSSEHAQHVVRVLDPAKES